MAVYLTRIGTSIMISAAFKYNAFSKWHCFLLVLSFPILLISSTASADTPIVPVFACLLPLWTSILTMGLVFILISSVEGAVVHFLAKLGWWRSMWVSFLANFASTLIGAIWYQQKATMGWMFLSIPVIAFAWKPRWYYAILGLFVAFFLVPLFNSQTVDYARAYWFLLPAFLLTYAVEGPFWLRTMPLKKALIATLTSNLASYSLLILFLLSMGVRAEDDPGLSIVHYARSARYLAHKGDAKRCLEVLEDAHRVAFRPQFGRWFRDSGASKDRLRWAGGWGDGAEWAVGPLMERGRYEDALVILRRVRSFAGINETDRNDLAKIIGKCEESLAAVKKTNSN